MTAKAQEAQAKNKKKFIRIKYFCIKNHYQESKNITYRVRENFANHISDKGMVSRTYKETT